jgi:hypothetical protein
VLGWWPAQRPDRVFTDPLQVGTPTAMKEWLAKVQGVEGANGLIALYGKLGIVKKEQSATGVTVFIERERALPR